MEFTVSLVDVPKDVIKAGEGEQRLAQQLAGLTCFSCMCSVTVV